MDLRDFFAGQALSGMLANEGTELDASTVDTLVPYMFDVYKRADAMLVAKNAKISEQSESPADSPATPAQQLQAEIRALHDEFRELYDGDFGKQRSAIMLKTFVVVAVAFGVGSVFGIYLLARYFIKQWEKYS